MKVCARCKQPINPGQEYCNRCGGTQFMDVQPQPKPQNQMNMQQNNSMGINQMQMQQPSMNNGIQQNMNQSMNQNNMQYGQNNMQFNQGNQYNNGMNQNSQMNFNQPNNMYNQMGQTPVRPGQNQPMQQQFTDKPKKKLFMSKAEKQAQMQNEMAMMKQMQQQRQAGQNGNIRPGQPNQQQVNSQFQDLPNEEMTVKDWIITLLFLIIPIWNIIYIVKSIKDY